MEKRSINYKPKIALIVDNDNWAFANIARQVVKYLNEYYDFRIIPIDYLNEDIISIFLMCQNEDLIHFFWRGLIVETFSNETRRRINAMGISYRKFLNKYVKKKNISTGIYDHLFSNEDDIEYINKMSFIINKYSVSSNKLFKIYNDLNIQKKPTMVITDGVDNKIFSPKNLKRFNNISKREIVIGWVGNSDWAGEIAKDLKGVNTILKPAIEELMKEGYKIKPYFADRQIRMIPHSEMPLYYSKIDLYICTSQVEGTPNPVLEAMACGVPIISTDVGIVRDAFGELQSKYILEKRNKSILKEKIIQLINRPGEFKKLSEENLQKINDWSWEKKAEEFKKFFDLCVKKEE